MATAAPPAIRFVPFTEVDFHAWLTQAIPAYALGNVHGGEWSLAESIGQSREAHAALLPQGLATPGHHFVHLHVEGEAGAVGHLWWSDTRSAGVPGVYVYGLEVDEPARRRGVARAALGELERVARSRGQCFVSLHVFGHNHGARRLYDALGFEPTNLTLRKNLS